MALTKVTSGGISDIAAAVEGASDSNKFTDADHTKLNAIEASATADQTNAEIKAAVEAATDSNTFTDADHSKLNAIEASATADQTDAEIRTAVEAASDSNVFTDADHTKLNAIEASATADQTKSDIEGLGIDVPAANLTGTIPDARFPATLPAISGANLTGVGVDGISSSADATAITIDSSENVGIGETTPIRKLVIAGSSGNNSNMLIHMDADTAGGECGIEFKADSTNDDRRIKAAIKYRRDDPGTRGTGNLHFCVNGDNSDVNVSTSHSRMMLNTDGLHFNGDTAAANALDDYEEGTFTLAMYSGQSGTITNHFAKYTKIGNTVTLNFRGTINNAQSNSIVRISGFPFSLANIHYAATANYSNRQSVQLFMSNGGYFYYQNTTVGGNNQGQDAAWLDASTGIAINVTYIA